MVKRRLRNPRRRQRRSSRSHVQDEFITFSLTLGGTQIISWSSLSTRPANCNIRPIFMSISASAAYVPATSNDSLPGYFVPSGLDCSLRDSAGKIVATSRPITLGSTPRQCICRYPRSGDWYPYNTTSGTGMAQINALCFGNPGVSISAYVRGIIHFRYQFSYEILTASCPTFLCDTDPQSSHLNSTHGQSSAKLSDVSETSAQSLTISNSFELMNLAPNEYAA